MGEKFENLSIKFNQQVSKELKHKMKEDNKPLIALIAVKSHS